MSRPIKLAWLVGEHNPYSREPGHALYPWPKRSAGHRLCEILNLPRREYLATFERRNLCVESAWSAREARVSAEEIQAEAVDGSVLILLGARVARAFGLEFRPFEAQLWAFGSAVEKSALCLPHPSGRSRLWNAADARVRARAAVAQACPSLRRWLDP